MYIVTISTSGHATIYGRFPTTAHATAWALDNLKGYEPYNPRQHDSNFGTWQTARNYGSPTLTTDHE